jgi:hypothetical protein
MRCGSMNDMTSGVLLVWCLHRDLMRHRGAICPAS